MNATNEQGRVLSGKKIAFIGCGIMGEAIITSLLKGEIVGAGQITGAEPLQDRCTELRGRYGINMVQENAAAVQGADLIMLTVKPQSLDYVFEDLDGILNPNQAVVSIAAGATVNRLRQGLQHGPIVRAMPNTPSQIGYGMTVWTATREVDQDQLDMVSAVLGAMGKAVQVSDENEVDMATALSGTGPAYIFMMMEALIDAGVHMGFSRNIAEELVMQTIIGSVLYAEETGKHPAELRNQVTSPGGTTAHALYHMEKGGLRTVMARAVWAAYQRTVELGTGDSTPVAPGEIAD